jgi:hypothetical protein
MTEKDGKESQRYRLLGRGGLALVCMVLAGLTFVRLALRDGAAMVCGKQVLELADAGLDRCALIGV